MGKRLGSRLGDSVGVDCGYEIVSYNMMSDGNEDAKPEVSPPGE